MDSGEPKKTGLEGRLSGGAARELPGLLAVALTAIVLAGLVVGYEPVGRDPDRMYRPLKYELSEALHAGRLPFWSYRMGLGLPLIAESHVAAFYPPNLVFYRCFEVRLAYRLLMWLHYVALAGTTYGYARTLGITPWGASMGAVSFVFCGFQAIHSSHEPFYLLMPYLPLALLIAERFLASGRAVWVPLLALCLGFQWTLGHFQIQMWTGGLVMLTAVWRGLRRPSLWKRSLALLAAVGWGMMIAAVQLGPTWEYSQRVRQTERETSGLAFYSFPPKHWFELAFPSLLRDIKLGPEDPYWYGEASTGFEASLYVGTIPLIFAIMGLTGRRLPASLVLWRIVAIAGFAMATMPQWWPEGYRQVIAIPGLGYFRVPARYTLLTSLGLALFAGEGFDRALSVRRFRLGLGLAVLFGGLAAASAYGWSIAPGTPLATKVGGIATGLLWGAGAWLVAIGLVCLWRARRAPYALLVVATALELGVLYYTGTTDWGWSIDVARDSPVFGKLAGENERELIGGELKNLPLQSGHGTADPYIGLAHSYPNKVLLAFEMILSYGTDESGGSKLDPAAVRRWFQRGRVTHVVMSRPLPTGIGEKLETMSDPILDQVVWHKPGESATRAWTITRISDIYPAARVATRVRKFKDRLECLRYLTNYDNLDTACYLATDDVPDRPNARSVRLVSWDGATAVVEHSGACDLIVARTHDPGWLARIDDGPEQSVLAVDVGFQGVRIPGSGTHRVTFRYLPPWFVVCASITTAATAAALVMIGAATWRGQSGPAQGLS